MASPRPPLRQEDAETPPSRLGRPTSVVVPPATVLAPLPFRPSVGGLVHTPPDATNAGAVGVIVATAVILRPTDARAARPTEVGRAAVVLVPGVLRPAPQVAIRDEAAPRPGLAAGQGPETPDTRRVGRAPKARAVAVAWATARPTDIEAIEVVAFGGPDGQARPVTGAPATVRPVRGRVRAVPNVPTDARPTRVVAGPPPGTGHGGDIPRNAGVVGVPA